MSIDRQTDIKIEIYKCDGIFTIQQLKGKNEISICQYGQMLQILSEKVKMKKDIYDMIPLI